MTNPQVSVIIPVYNTAAYLMRALQSVLQQGLNNLEIILINDGSTDHSADVIRQVSDPRILYLENERNMGLVYTLNKGLDLARGAYIARMDGDDISMPGRLEAQLAYLQQHPEVDVLATVVELIDEQDQPIGFWEADRTHVTADAIRQYLPVDNCLAHPSIMAKAEVLKQYRYLEQQRQAEDYDLWLRMAADGRVIHKLAEPLVRHRIVHNSFTRSRQQNVFRKLAVTKYRFAGRALAAGKWNGFVFHTLWQANMDIVKALGKTIRRSV